MNDKYRLTCACAVVGALLTLPPPSPRKETRR